MGETHELETSRLRANFLHYAIDDVALRGTR